jgi:hypothetical protein
MGKMDVRKFIILIVSVATIIGCKKNEHPIPVVIENDTKTATSGFYAFFVNGDTITLNDENYRITESPNRGLYIDAGGYINPPYCAHYPSNVCHWDCDDEEEYSAIVDIPQEYSCWYDNQNRQVIKIPLITFSPYGGEFIKFKKLTAAVRLYVQNCTTNNLTIDSAIVSSDTYKLNGIFTLNFSDDDLEILPEQGSGSVKVIINGNEITPNSVIEVRVPIRPINTSILRIKIYTHEPNGNVHIFDKRCEVDDQPRGYSVGNWCEII